MLDTPIKQSSTLETLLPCTPKLHPIETITYKTLKDWVLSKPADEMVGIPCHPTKCMLAMMLQEQYPTASFSVIIYSNEYVQITTFHWDPTAPLEIPRKIILPDEKLVKALERFDLLYGRNHNRDFIEYTRSQVEHLFAE